MQHPRDQALAEQQHDQDECADLAQREQDGEADLPRLVPCEGAAILRNLIAQLGPCRQEDEGEDHRDVLDDQPADGDAAAFGLHHVPFLKGAQQHHGGGDGEGEAEDDPAF